ncbi:MAG TPA: TonB-dependent receptor [Opitutaceae bacterium]|nr:TonB-dependent receptor [Opitutaceae bacterium]
MNPLSLDSFPASRALVRLFGRVSRLLQFSAIVLLAVSLPARGQAPAPAGIVEGRVQNSATGKYLHNARVRVVGTDIEVFTNSAGEYRIAGIPPGQATLNVFYTGMAPQQLTVTVASSGVAQQDVAMRSLSDQGPETLVMSQYVVASQRETDAAAIAINEQRFAANKREVVSTDAFGEINQGNIGEFVKHLPGISFEVKDGNNPSGIMVRGFNSNYTNVTLDGGQLASAALSNTQTHTRQFVLEQANINNIARIEVVKLPTPDMSANLLGGAVNFVSKSAFEHARPEFRFSAYLSANEKALDFEKTPGPGEGDDFKIRPSFDLSYVNPVSKTFGFTVNAAHSSQFYLQNRSVLGRRYSGSGASVTNPQTTSMATSYAPNLVNRTSGSVGIDWKPLPGNVLKFTAQANAFEQQQATRTLTYNVGNSTPSAWGETFTEGTATGTTTGSTSLGNSFQGRHGLTRALTAQWMFDRDDWSAEIGANWSHSNSNARDMAKGFWRGMGTSLRGIRTVSIAGINNDDATYQSVAVRDASGNPIDTTKIANYNLGAVQGEPQSAEDTLGDYRASIARNFRIFGRSFSLELGGAINDLKREIDYAVFATTYAGPNGILNDGDEGMGAFVDSAEAGRSAGFGSPGVEWASPWVVWKTYQEHPTWFVRTPGQQGDTVRNIALRSPWLHEKISSGYLMADTKVFQRLRLVGGVRYELTENEGLGVAQDNSAIFQRDASGVLLRNPVNNQFIRKPEAGVAGSAEEAALIYKYRGRYSSRDYDGFFPSVHSTFNLTENLLVRAAFAKTIGRPRLVDMVPNISVTDELDPATAGRPGIIQSANTTLKPWSAKNYDYSLEYYLPRNGVVSFSYFKKDIRDFFGNLNRPADAALLEEIGLPSNLIGYEYRTRINVGDARITGWEANLVFPLENLTAWSPMERFAGVARHFTVRGNITHLQLSGSRTGPADFGNYIPRGRNIGLQFHSSRLTGGILVNYKGKMLRDSSGAFPGALEYIRERYQVDGNLEIQVTKRFSVFFAARNLLNATTEWEVSGAAAPGWAALTNYEEYGAQYSLGIKGTF